MNTNYIYDTLARDGNSEAQSFSFTKSTSGTTPADSLKIAKVTTNGSSVTAVSQTNLTDTLQYALLPTGSIQLYAGQYDNIPNVLQAVLYNMKEYCFLIMQLFHNYDIS